MVQVEIQKLTTRKRDAFALVELVVVIMLIAILGAITAPRWIGTRQNTPDSKAIKALNNVRNAIAMYTADNGGLLPGATDGLEATFKTDVTTYLRSPFPRVGVGTLAGDATKDDTVLMSNSTMGLTGAATSAEGWAYSYATGEFIINCDDATITDPNINYDDL